MTEKKKSRIQRWQEAASEASNQINILLEIQGEYEDWKDSLPENLQSSALGEKLEEVCCIDLQWALDAIDEAGSVDLPLGFGRD
jgi:hypothetical protein